MSCDVTKSISHLIFLGGNPLFYIAHLIFGVLSLLLSLSWIYHLINNMFLVKPVSPFLNEYLEWLDKQVRSCYVVLCHVMSCYVMLCGGSWHGSDVIHGYVPSSIMPSYPVHSCSYAILSHPILVVLSWLSHICTLLLLSSHMCYQREY